MPHQEEPPTDNWVINLRTAFGNLHTAFGHCVPLTASFVTGLVTATERADIKFRSESAHDMMRKFEKFLRWWPDDEALIRLHRYWKRRFHRQQRTKRRRRRGF